MDRSESTTVYEEFKMFVISCLSSTDTITIMPSVTTPLSMGITSATSGSYIIS